MVQRDGEGGERVEGGVAVICHDEDVDLGCFRNLLEELAAVAIGDGGDVESRASLCAAALVIRNLFGVDRAVRMPGT